MKLIVDTASILGRFMHTTDPEFGIDMVHEGRKYHIPSFETCMERAEVTFERTLREQSLRWTDVILVLEQSGTGAARKKLCPTYKANRESRPKEFYNVFNQLVTEFSEFAMRKGSVTAVSTQILQVEGDDLAAEICKRFPETILFTGDKDLLAAEATHHLLWDELDPCKWPVPRELIILYRCLVTGDTSDGIKSCKGFGEKAWDELKGLIGWDGLHELDKMFQEKRLHELAEDVPHLKKLQLLIDQAEDLYMSYKLMQPMHVPAHKVRWSARVTDCSKVLVTAENFERCKGEVIEELSRCSHVTLDYETDIPDKAREWLAGTFDPETGKQAVTVDVIASRPTGAGIKINDKAWYFSTDHFDTDNITIDQLKEIILLIKDKRVYAHNSTNFENVVTYNTFGVFMEEIVDTRILASYVDENDFQNLKHCSSRWLEYQQETYEQVMARAREARPERECKGMKGVTGLEVLSYGIDDVVVTDSLQNLFQCILAYEKTLDVFYEVEQKAALVTSVAFIKGVPFNQEAYDKLKAENDQKTLELEAKVDQQLLELGWGESSFKPYLVLTGKTVKELFHLVTGYELKTAARSVGSVVEAIENEQAIVADQLSDEEVLDKMLSVRVAVSKGIEAVNELAEKYWKPKVEFNVRSPKQVADLLYNTLGCPVRITNPPTEVMIKKGIYEGNPSTKDAAFKNALAFKDPTEEGMQLLQDILEFKKCVTRESLFLRKYPSLRHWYTGNLHCSMQQSGTNTRRFTHSAPNFAQLPSKKGKEVRELLMAPKGFKIVSLDIDSQELKLQAWDSQCQQFLACYTGPKEERKDVHAATGFFINLKSENCLASTEEEFIKLYKSGDDKAYNFRYKGKTVNFSTAYGCRAKKLSQELCCHEKEAVKFMQAKDEAFPGLNPHVEKYCNLCQSRGYSETFEGGRRHLAKQFAMAKGQGELDKVRRLAWSFRIQGSGACQIKIAMGKLWTKGIVNMENCYVGLQVHDELCLIIREDVLEEKITQAHDVVCEQYAGMLLEVGSTPEVGDNFGSLVEYSVDKDK